MQAASTGAPLLNEKQQRVNSAAASRARRALRRCAAAAIANSRAEKLADPGKPDLKVAVEYNHYFLPKNADGKLLPLGSGLLSLGLGRESDMAEHVGSGVAIYMRFQRTTMWMFVLATIFALPQFYTNIHGHDLGLQWPLDAACDAPEGLISWLIYTVSGLLQYFLYGFLLGNVTLEATFGIPHLVSELLLSTMFCCYVYFIAHINKKQLVTIEAEGKPRASDFSVFVQHLPPLGSDPASLRAHFSYFGDVAAVAVSNDHRHLLKLLREQQGLKARWRDLHLEYARALTALRARSHEGEVQVHASPHISPHLPISPHISPYLALPCPRLPSDGHLNTGTRREQPLARCPRQDPKSDCDDVECPAADPCGHPGSEHCSGGVHWPRDRHLQGDAPCGCMRSSL